MKIITVTLNPAFDIHCIVENLQIYKENYASDVIKHAGGKGINISRALKKYGIDNTAYCILGDAGGNEFLSMLEADGINCQSITVSGRIRENITIHSQNGETRISFEGFKTDKDILNELFLMIEKEKTDDMVVTFTGRLCEGITTDDAVDFLLKIKGIGAKVVVDCNSFSVDDLLKIKPFLIKPNEQEIAQLTGCEVSDTDVLKAAENFFDGGVENVIISLGAKGFIFKNNSGAYRITVPKIKPVSTIGAGDSTLAGFVAGISKQLEICDILKLAASFGTAACLAEGTNPPMADVIDKTVKSTICERI